MRFYKTPKFVQTILPGLTWRKETNPKTIYLTFDDGPIPEVTEFVLEELARYQAKATFFCVGENLRNNSQIAQRAIAAGHKLGNHTFNHLKGWLTTTPEYLHNIQLCEEQLSGFQAVGHTKLFRPPHGRITKEQFRAIKTDYHIIMWEVLTYDFDVTLTPEKCLAKAIINTKPGSIVVFHDSLKARRNMEYTLPKYLTYFANQGYCFESL